MLLKYAERDLPGIRRDMRVQRRSRHRACKVEQRGEQQAQASLDAENPSAVMHAEDYPRGTGTFRAAEWTRVLMTLPPVTDLAPPRY